MDASSWEAGALVAGAAVILVGALAMGQRGPRNRPITIGQIAEWHKVWHLIQSWVASDASITALGPELDKLESEIGDDCLSLLSQVQAILDGSGLDEDVRSKLAPLIGTFFPTATPAPPTTTPPVVPGDNGEVARLEAELAQARGQIENQKVSLGTLRSQVDEAEAKTAVDAETIRVTRDSLTLADGQIATLRRQLADADQSGVVASLQSTVSQLQAQIAAQPADQSGQVASLTAELDQARAQRDTDVNAIASLNAQIAGLTGDFDNVRSQMAAQGAQLGEAIAALEACRAAQGDTSSTDALNAEIIALRSAADTAQAQLAAVANERDSLASQVGSSAQVAVDRDAANARAEAAEAEVRRLKDALAASAGKVFEVGELRERVDALRAQEIVNVNALAAKDAEIDSIRGLLAAEQGRANAGVDVLAGKDAEIQALTDRAVNAENRAGTSTVSLPS